MSTTVLDVLQSAQMNFQTLGLLGATDNPLFLLALGQLTSAVEALEDDLGPDDVMQLGV